MLSRPIVAYYDPIRPSHRHGATSRALRLYAPPSLCGSAEATHETFPPFPARLSLRAADPTPVGSLPPPVVLGQTMTGFLALGPSRHPHIRLCQQCPAGAITALHHSLYAAARRFASPSWLAPTQGAHALPLPPEDFVTLAFTRRPHGTRVRVRLDG